MGNVGFHLSSTIDRCENLELIEVYNRTTPSKFPSDSIKKKTISNIKALKPSDVYIICVNDRSVKEVSDKIPFANSLVVHCSATISQTTINDRHRKGVFYPLQTFSKEKSIDFSTIPICLETQNSEDLITLKSVASLISNAVFLIDEKKRQLLHLSAVFVCNFVNHLYTIGEHTLKENNLPFELLKPLIIETSNKILQLPPTKAQTGPAIRQDQPTIDFHLSLIDNQIYSSIYKLLTQSIQNSK